MISKKPTSLFVGFCSLTQPKLARRQPEGVVRSKDYYLYSTIASIIMCEITGVKRNRLNYIVITQTLFYNYLTRTNLKSFLHAIVISTEERNLEDSSLRSE